MNGFYIKKITASGIGVPDAAIDLIDGVNIIYGPSDTGKTYVIRCIDYLFGADQLPMDDGQGYDHITLTVVCRDGGSFEISRKLNEKKVIVSGSTSTLVKDGGYGISSDEFRKLFLSLIGIDEEVRLVSKQDYSKTQELSWRTIKPMFFIHEEHIFRSDSIVTTPRFNNITAALSALKYLYDGKQISIPDMENKLGVETSRKAVIAYISGRLQTLKDEKKSLEKAIADVGNIGIDQLIEQQAAELEVVVQEMESLENETSELLRKKVVLGDAIKELQYLQERYYALAAGYQADIRRLKFIIDAEGKQPKGEQQLNCPFCSGAIQPKQRKSLAGAAGAEAASIRFQLSELEVLIRDNNTEIDRLKIELTAVDEQYRVLQDRITNEYQPRLAELRSRIGDLEYLCRMKARLDCVNELEEDMDADLTGISSGEKQPLSYDAKAELGQEFYELLDQYISEMLSECKYDPFNSARLNHSDFDIIIDGKKKKNHGKGYRAFLNTVLAYCIVRLLSHNGRYSSGILVLDSPILSLKEKDEQTSSAMKEGLFKYFVQTDFPCQIIIAENDIPNIDYGKTNLIHFTKDHDCGRYGFLMGNQVLYQ